MIVNAQVEASLIIINYLKKYTYPVSLRMISRDTGLSYRFVVKVAFVLKRHGILVATQGRQGGYQLAPGWDKTNLHELMGLFSKKGFWVKCEDKEYMCPYQDVCSHQAFFTRYLSSLTQQVTLGQILEVS